MEQKREVVIGVGIFLIAVVLILWWLYGYHYEWIPLETTFGSA